MNIEQAVELLKAFDKYPQRIPAPQPGFVYELTPTPDWAIFQAEMLLRELSQNEEVMGRVADWLLSNYAYAFKSESGIRTLYDARECSEEVVDVASWITQAISLGMACKQIMGEG